MSDSMFMMMSICCICCISSSLSGGGGYWYSLFDSSNAGYLYPECNYGPIWGNLFGGLPLKPDMQKTLSDLHPYKSLILKDAYKLEVTYGDAPSGAPAPSAPNKTYTKSESCFDKQLARGDTIKIVKK